MIRRFPAILENRWKVILFHETIPLSCSSVWCLLHSTISLSTAYTEEHLLVHFIAYLYFIYGVYSSNTAHWLYLERLYQKAYIPRGDHTSKRRFFERPGLESLQ
jgi:hypothetical protein